MLQIAFWIDAVIGVWTTANKEKLIAQSADCRRISLNGTASGGFS
ncbi:MAG: hypothetical protein ACI9VS_001101 [Candidatus Binatia bacterium]|jgi:hypothetical protein